MPILAPFEAFSRDVSRLKVEEDTSRLPLVWFVAAQVAARLADATEPDRQQLVRIWVAKARDSSPDAEVWRKLAVPGIAVTNLATAAQTLIAIGHEARLGGALNLAYSAVTHTRIALFGRGPASVRARATLEQAETLRAMGLADETLCTLEAALEDAIRADDRDFEASISAAIAELPPPPVPSKVPG